MLKKIILILAIAASLQGCFQRVIFSDIDKANAACKGEENVVFITSHFYGAVYVHCSNGSNKPIKLN